MREADVALTPMPQADGQTKARPVVLLKQMPPFVRLVGLRHQFTTSSEAAGFDGIIKLADTDFRRSGLRLLHSSALDSSRFFPMNASSEFSDPFPRSGHERILQRLCRIPSEVKVNYAFDA